MGDFCSGGGIRTHIMPGYESGELPVLYPSFILINKKLIQNDGIDRSTASETYQVANKLPANILYKFYLAVVVFRFLCTSIF